MSKTKYPGVYVRRQKLWIKYYDANGSVVRESTGLPIGKEKQAAEIRRALVERIARSKQIVADAGGDPTEDVLTLATYGRRWVKARIARGLASARDDETRFKLHVNPRAIDGRPFGEMPLADVRPRHIRDLVRLLKEERTLAPRTIRNVYGMLHAMFVDAKLDELVASNPCELPRDVLPKRVDKDPLWRSTAKFSRDEVERLISDERIPWDRRVINAILFLGACRWGEMAALRWREYEPSYDGGLGRIVFARSFDYKQKRIKSVKTEVPRWMPVHPTLATILAEWKLGGWEQMMGRRPTPDDLIVPNAPVLTHSSGVPLRTELQELNRQYVRDLPIDSIEHCRAPQLGLRRAKDDCEVLGNPGPSQP
jgi:integrase